MPALLMPLTFLALVYPPAKAALPIFAEPASPCGVTANCVPTANPFKIPPSSTTQSSSTGNTPTPPASGQTVGPADCPVEAGGTPCPSSTGVASQGNQGGASLGAGNPINLVSGNKYQREEDLPALPGVLGLEIIRHYNSAYSTPNTNVGILGRGWKLSYETTLYVTGSVIQIIQADGKRIMFARNPQQPSLCASNDPAHGQLRIHRTASGEQYEWTWPNGKTLQFDQGGRLVQIAVPTGEFVSLQHDAQGMLVQVTDPQGRQLHLQYPSKKDTSGRFGGVATITSPVGQFAYAYGSAVPTDGAKAGTANTDAVKTDAARANLAKANLVSVRLPAGGGSRLYHYEDTLRPTYLTGISVQDTADTKSVPHAKRIGTYLYDRNGRAVLTVRGTPATLQRGADQKPLQPARLVPGTGIGQVTLDYSTPGMTVLTNSLGQQSTYRHTIIAGQYRLLEVRGAGCQQCGEMNVRYGYDRLGRQTVVTHLTPEGTPIESRRTAYDTEGRPLQVTSTRYEKAMVGAVGTTETVGTAGTPRLIIRYEYAGKQPTAQSPQPPADQTTEQLPSPLTSPLPTVIARPSIVPGKEHRLDIAYNTHGQPTRIEETGFRPAEGSSAQPIHRQTLYRYQTVNGRSLLAEVDGPLKNGPLNTPVDSDITRYAWSNDGSVIEQITYPTGRVARFDYERDTPTATTPDTNTTDTPDASLRLVRSTGIDGVVTSLTYNARGAVTQMNRGGAITYYRRDAAGRATQVTSPTGETVQFEFGHGSSSNASTSDLSAILDRQNNRIELLRDTEGELTQARLREPSGALAQQPRLFGAATDTQSTQSQQDPSRNPVSADLRALIATVSTDTTNVARPDPIAPFAILDAFKAAAELVAIDGARSAQSSAIDAAGNLTTYLTDDFGNLVRAQSPVTGTTTYTYDAADRIQGKHTADGSHVAYQRDAAGRVIAVQAYSPANHLDENATITWGKANKPVAIRYLAGAETFAYDDAARLIAHTQTIDGKAFTLTYRYNSAGQLLAKTLPDGQQLTYRYRGSQHPKAGLLESVWLAGTNNPTTQTITAGLLDRPIVAGMNSEADRYRQRRFSFGNGLTNERVLDQQGRVVKAGNAQVGQTSLDYDPLANVRPDDPAAVGYATAHAIEDGAALTEPTRVTTTHAILLGQRAQEQAAQALISRLHGAATGWQDRLPSSPDVTPPLIALSPTAATALALATRFDQLGRQTQQGAMHYTYDSLNRLTGIDRVVNSAQQEQGHEIARYRYNLFGQRIAKTVALANGKATKTTHYFYDGSHLVFEASNQDQNQDQSKQKQSKSTKQYVWVNDKPIAMLQGSSILAIHTDHRNAPIAVTDEARQVVWQAKISDYLHSTPAQDNATDQALGTITFNLRGSNQYFDSESGLHYNTQRYFDPVATRYLTPDPLGLAVGPDLYAFALNRPQSVSDPLGLEPTLVLDGPSGVRANTNTNTNTSLAGWRYEDKLKATVTRAIPMLPGEVGAALQEMVKPENLAAVGAAMAIFAGIQFIPGADVVIDLIVAGTAVYMLGSGAIDLIKTLVTLDANISSAKCTGDLDLAARALAAGLVKSTGEVVVGAAAGYSSISGGGIRRIADGIRKVTDFAKGRFWANGGVNTADEYVNILSSADRQHIIFGDGPGSGGHMYPGQPGKSIYPQSWREGQILHNVGDVVTSPATQWYAQTGTGGVLTKAGDPARWVAWETRDGVSMRVVFEPATGRTVTAFPDSAPATITLKPIKK